MFLFRAVPKIKPLFDIFKNVYFDEKKWHDVKTKIFLMVLFTQMFVAKASHCNLNQFMCKNGDCIRQTKLCDGRLDCSDNSDEIDCGKLVI